MTDRRRGELYAAFDETAAELLRLGVPEETLSARLHALLEGATP